MVRLVATKACHIWGRWRLDRALWGAGDLVRGPAFGVTGFGLVGPSFCLGGDVAHRGTVSLGTGTLPRSRRPRVRVASPLRLLDTSPPQAHRGASPYKKPRQAS